VGLPPAPTGGSAWPARATGLSPQLAVAIIQSTGATTTTQLLVLFRDAQGRDDASVQHWRRSTVIMLVRMRFFTCYCPIFGYPDGQRISRALVSSVGEQKVCGGKARRVHISLERRRASWSAAPLGKMERSLPSVTAPRNADELDFWSACSTKFYAVRLLVTSCR